MRIAVLIVGILGSLAALGLGVLLFAFQDTPERRFEQLIAEELRRNREHLNAEDSAILRAYDRGQMAVWFLFTALPLGIAGAFMAKEGRGFSGAALLFLAVLGPTVLAWKSLLFTFPLAVAVCLCLIDQRPRPARAG